jgi:hypothetical protein
MAPGCASAACSALASHSRGGRQSSSVKTTIGARAARQAALRLAPGGLEPGARRMWRSVPCRASGCASSSASVSGAGRVVRDDDLEPVALEGLLGQRFEQPPQPQRPVV